MGNVAPYAKRPEQYQPHQAKVFLDRECLLDGYDWQACFLHALISSIVMVCLLSFSKHGRGSLGALTTLCPSEGKDRVDNVLLELIIGQELQALGKQTAQSAPCVIFPILLGPQRQDCSFDRFPFDNLGLLSPEPSVMTNDRAATAGHPRHAGSWRQADPGNADTLGQRACRPHTQK